MTDRVLFILNEKWALGFDTMQWMLMKYERRQNKDRRSPWKPVSFIGSTKRILLLTVAEKGIQPTPEAQAALDALPESFREWIAWRDMREAAE